MSKLDDDLAKVAEEEQLKRFSFGHLPFLPAERVILSGWGFEKPYLGEELVRTSTEHWVGWQGEPSRHHEIPLLVARTGLNQVIDEDSFWSYGYTTVDELERAPDRVETILNAAYLLGPGGVNVRLITAIQSLNGLVPAKPVQT